LIQKRIIVIFAVAFVLLASQFWGNRERAETHDGMNLVPTFNTKVNNIDLNFINTIDKQQLHIFYDINHINNTRNDFLAFVIPYEGTLAQNYSGWKVLPVNDEHATIIYKKFFCSPSSPCSIDDYNNMDFVFNNNIDSKYSYTYSLAIPFSDAILNPKIPIIISTLEPHEKVGWNQDGLKTTVRFTLKQESTILNAIPSPEPNFFLASGTNQTNNVLNWHVSEDSLIYASYEIPSEKNWFFIITSISFVLLGTAVTLLVTYSKSPQNLSQLNSSMKGSNKKEDGLEQNQDQKNTKLILGLVTIGSLCGIFAVYWQHQVEINTVHDLSNYFVFFISLGFGSGLSLALYVLSKRDQQKIGMLVGKIGRQQDEISKLITKIGKLEEKQEQTLNFLAQSLKEKQKSVGENIVRRIEHLHGLLDNASTLYAKFQSETNLVKKNNMFNSLHAYTTQLFYAMNLDISRLDFIEIFGETLSLQYTDLLTRCAFPRDLFDYDDTGRAVMTHFEDIKQRSEGLKESVNAILQGIINDTD